MRFHARVALPLVVGVGLLASPAAAGTQVYDGANRLVSSSNGTTTTVYRYDGLGQLVGQCSSTSGGPSQCADLVVDDVLSPYPEIVGEVGASDTALRAYSMAGLHAEQGTTAAVRYALTDALSTVRGAASATGGLGGRRSYDAYGGVRAITLPAIAQEAGSIGFTGAREQSDGTVYLRARFYQPSAGRFLSRDTFPGVTTESPSLNRYSYANNSPTGLVDPSGHIATKGGPGPLRAQVDQFYRDVGTVLTTNPLSYPMWQDPASLANGGLSAALNFVSPLFGLAGPWENDARNGAQSLVNGLTRRDPNCDENARDAAGILGLGFNVAALLSGGKPGSGGSRVKSPGDAAPSKQIDPRTNNAMRPALETGPASPADYNWALARGGQDYIPLARPNGTYPDKLLPVPTLGDLQALTKATGLEHALVTKNGNVFLVRGNENSVALPPELSGARFGIHTHPPGASVGSSQADADIHKVYGSGASIMSDQNIINVPIKK